MTSRLATFRRRLAGEDGMTLVELLVSMLIFAILMALISSAVILMQHSLRKQQGQSDDLDGARKVVTLLDHQARYANALRPVSTSGTATYITWQTGDLNQPQSCTQWRYDSSAHTLAYREWDVITTTPTPTPTPSATATTSAAATAGSGYANLSSWSVQAYGVEAITGTPVFSNVVLSSSVLPSAATNHAAATFVFGVRHGTPSTLNKTQLTVTAINTSNAGTSSSVCGQVS